jgi:large subunit ribosomal protein L18
MATTKKDAREYRRKRIRKKIQGTTERPRLSIFKSLNHFHAQIIDDLEGKTLLGFSTQSKDFPAKDRGNVKGAHQLGKLVAEKAIQKKIVAVVFDRGGFIYHGRVKAFADGAREGGLKF